MSQLGLFEEAAIVAFRTALDQRTGDSVGDAFSCYLEWAPAPSSSSDLAITQKSCRLVEDFPVLRVVLQISSQSWGGSNDYLYAEACLIY